MFNWFISRQVVAAVGGVAAAGVAVAGIAGAAHYLMKKPDRDIQGFFEGRNCL